MSCTWRSLWTACAASGRWSATWARPRCGRGPQLYCCLEGLGRVGRSACSPAANPRWAGRGASQVRRGAWGRLLRGRRKGRKRRQRPCGSSSPATRAYPCALSAVHSLQTASLTLSPPTHDSHQVNYREGISRNAEIRYVHKKQSGGSGQFADVAIRFEPGEAGTGFVFRRCLGAGLGAGTSVACSQEGGHKLNEQRGRPCSYYAPPRPCRLCRCASGLTSCQTLPLRFAARSRVAWCPRSTSLVSPRWVGRAAAAAAAAAAAGAARRLSPVHQYA